MPAVAICMSERLPKHLEDVLHEQRNAFIAEAQRRWEYMQRTGEYFTLEDMREYAMALARGERPARPVPRTMAPEELARLRDRARRADLA